MAGKIGIVLMAAGILAAAGSSAFAVPVALGGTDTAGAHMASHHSMHHHAKMRHSMTTHKMM